MDYLNEIYTYIADEAQAKRRDKIRTICNYCGSVVLFVSIMLLIGLVW